MFNVKTIKQNASVIPILVWIAFLVGIPLIYVVALSFFTRDSLGNVVFELTLGNYKKLLDPVYLKVFFNSFLMAALTGLTALFIGYPVAYITANLKSKTRSFVIALIILPFWISSLLRTYGWIILLGKTGLINNVLLGTGILKNPLSMMYSFWTVLVGTTYMLIPFMIVALFNSIDKLDWSMLEASYDLGAGRWKTFFNVTLPLTMPGIAGGFTLVFIPALGMFFISDLLGGGKNIFLGNQINTLITKGRNKPLAAAFSVGMIILVILVLFAYSRIAKNRKEGLFL